GGDPTATPQRGKSARAETRPVAAGVASTRHSTPAEYRSRLHMDGAFADRKRGFLDRFRARRVSMAGARQILGGTAELHQHAGFMDHLAGLAADDVTA